MPKQTIRLAQAPQSTSAGWKVRRPRKTNATETAFGWNAHTLMPSKRTVPPLKHAFLRSSSPRDSQNYATLKTVTQMLKFRLLQRSEQGAFGALLWRKELSKNPTINRRGQNTFVLGDHHYAVGAGRCSVTVERDMVPNYACPNRQCTV